MDSGYINGKTPKLLKAVSWETTIDLIRLVPQYATLTGIHLTQLPLSVIESTARFVRSPRLNFAFAILHQMLNSHIEPFCPIIVRCSQGKRIVVPPVVEEHDGRFFLLDGTHRIWIARQLGLTNVLIIQISGLDLPLPSKPFLWENMTIREDHYTTEENLIDLDRSLFRPITTTFNGPQTLVLDAGGN